ncbi:MAG: serine/threonine-protein phosphatase, partial [Methanospirillum sp.]|uniref:PP2C family protein-serine/threonine phosphatase n=1 Tax=Methanospirillum sp. TaxID=45200 RepID=UPI0023759912
TGIAIGILDDIPYDQKSVQLHTGDVILLYTDGVTEAVNPANEEFGVPRLITTMQNSLSLPVQDIVDTVVTSVSNFSGTQPQHDDITLLIIRVHES